jgi:hypothetical protein
MASASLIPPYRPSQYPLSRNSFYWSMPAPTTEELIATMEARKQPRVIYEDPFFSIPSDIPKDKEYGGRFFALKDHTIKNLPPFHHWGKSMARAEVSGPSLERRTTCSTWEYARRPPTVNEMRRWLAEQRNEGE